MTVKFGKAIMENIRIKEMNIGLVMEIKKQKKVIEQKDKMIFDMINGTAITNLTAGVLKQRRLIKSLKIALVISWITSIALLCVYFTK